MSVKNIILNKGEVDVIQSALILHQHDLEKWLASEKRLLDMAARADKLLVDADMLNQDLKRIAKLKMEIENINTLLRKLYAAEKEG